MICPQCCGFDEFFNAKMASRQLKRYRRKGPVRSTRLLIEALLAEGVGGTSLIDIGGGIGAIQHELIRAGARRAVDVDGSRAYIDAARREARRQGHADRVQFHLGDFVDLADRIEPADIVTLDRVVCCYPDMQTLLDRSTARARRLCGLVFPRRNWIMKLALPLLNTLNRLRRCPMRLYLHPPAEIDRVIREAGLGLRCKQKTLLWEVAVYARAG